MVIIPTLFVCPCLDHEQLDTLVQRVMMQLYNCTLFFALNEIPQCFMLINSFPYLYCFFGTDHSYA